MMPLCGTYDYVAIVPDDPLSSQWNLQLRESLQQRGNELSDKRLVGYSPRLTIQDVGMRPDTPEWQKLPCVRLIKITLTADSRDFAQAAAHSFFLQRELFAQLCSGYRVHLSRGSNAGIGISAFRQEQLLFAVGAVRSVPLGQLVKVYVPESVWEAERIIRKEYPEYNFTEYPLGIHVGDQKELLHKGYFHINGYEGHVWNAIKRQVDGDCECMAISLEGGYSVVVANSSAKLLAHGPKEIVHW
jgi:hypothetical protein